MMAPVVFTVTRQIKFPAFPAVLFIGLCANFMGTALLLGDLPPQMLLSVSGVEFSGFIWHSGRPSSFFVLTLTYLCVVGIFFFRFIKVYGPKAMPKGAAVDTTIRKLDHFVKDKTFTFLVLFFFLATIVAMSFRKALGWHLGFIALMGATLLILTLEALHKRLKLSNPSFEEILSEMDWRAIFFYVSLFALVGGLEKAGLIKAVADWLVPYIKGNLLAGFSLLYWATVPIVGLVEHDAYILTFLYVIRDLGTYHGMNPWPLWWGLLWAGTLGSNLTIAGAPALFVALNCSQKEDACKINLKEFLSYSVPYVLSSTIICFVIAVLVWVLPYVNH
jgi:Na+/H+ antiporter NhaD/arsenite permease-like protein